jgi:hypothetical protein
LAANVRPIIAEIQAGGATSLRAVAKALVIGFRKRVPRNAGWQRLFEPAFALSPAALMCLGGKLIGITGIAFYAWNVGESATQSLVDRMHHCTMVLDDTARLFCYDSLGPRQPAKGANAPAIPMGTR